jgi:hypothetical protein
MTVKALTQFFHKPWDDGFAAFGNDERRLADLGGTNALSGLLQGRISNQPNLEGFLMEVGLWRNDGACYEELSLEREGDDFFVQHWRFWLTTGGQQDGQPCYYREAATFVRGNLHKLFPENAISTYEVIVPEDRLRFYLTKGGK